MKRIWKERPKVPRERTWLEVLPLDPRDLDVLRAKSLARRKETSRWTVDWGGTS